MLAVKMGEQRLSSESGEMEEEQNPLSKPHRDRVRELAPVKLLLPTAPLVTNLRRQRRGRSRGCHCTGHQIVRVVSDAGCERIHEKVKRVKVLFLLSHRRKRARCRDLHQP